MDQFQTLQEILKKARYITQDGDSVTIAFDDHITATAFYDLFEVVGDDAKKAKSINNG